MKYYYVDPEVAGDFGKSTIVDTSTHPPKIENLEPKIIIPDFHRINIIGLKGLDYCFIGEDFRLVVSEKFKSILEISGNKFVDFEAFN